MYKKTLIRMFSYLAAYRGRFVLSVVMALVYVLSSLYIPLLAGQAIDSLIGPGRVDFSLLTGRLAAILVTSLVCFLSQYILSRLNNTLVYSLSRNLRNDAFDKIGRLPFAYLDSHRQGAGFPSEAFQRFLHWGACEDSWDAGRLFRTSGLRRRPWGRNRHDCHPARAFSGKGKNFPALRGRRSEDGGDHVQDHPAFGG